MFCELNSHSYYSFLEGASSPEDLVDSAQQCGMKALALTDRNGLYGAIPFFRECRRVGIKPIVGAHVDVEGDGLILLCKDNTGYSLLCRLLTEGYRQGEKGAPRIMRESLLSLREHVICLVEGKSGRLAQAASKGSVAEGEESLLPYRAIFGAESVYVTLSHHHDLGDEERCRWLVCVAKSAHVSVVATNGARYATKDGAMLYDVLLCIKNGTRLKDSHHIRPGNHERYLKNAQEMATLFQWCPEAVESSGRIADQCGVDLDFSEYRLPQRDDPDVDGRLEKLCEAALKQKMAATAPSQAAARLNEELRLIAELNLSGYFLMVWDIVEYAKSRKIPVQGRGSAANSLVAYLLGITPVDPIENSLFFGRFLSEGMTTAPDIDLDFASTRDATKPDREDVIQYIYEKYGQDHVAMVCTFVTFKARSAIREVGKVMSLPDDVIDRMARLVGHYAKAEAIEELSTKEWQCFASIVRQIGDLPRHPSIHVGGMVITSRRISDIVPLEPARMEGRTVCQWDKDMIDDAGLIKVDILGLGMLAVVRESVDIAQRCQGVALALDCLPFNDPAVYEMIGQADTVGVFQVESRAQMQSLPRTRPRNFLELGIQVAIIRPGPLQGNMVSPYIRRRQGRERVRYPAPSLEPILEETLGVILFQEQVLQVAVAMAGFSPGQAEALRRAMSRKRSKKEMEQLKELFFHGAEQRKFSPEAIQDVFGALEGFAAYGFCKSHALSFARLSYLSAWLKKYHPAAFAAALINNQPMGFYSSKTLLEDAKRHGVGILPVDINASEERCSVSEGAIRLGFIVVKGMSDDVAGRVVVSRKSGPFSTFRDYLLRCPCRRRINENLIQAGAFDCFGLARRQLLWLLWLSEKEAGGFINAPPPAPALPQEGAWEKLFSEERAMGFSADKHFVALLRERLDRRGVVSSEQLSRAQDRQCVCVGGMITCYQRPPSAKGYSFVTLEDEKGLVNVIIPPEQYVLHRVLLRTAPLIIAQGILQRSDGVTNVIAQRLEAID